MNNGDSPRFATVMTALHEVFGGTPSRVRTDSYFESLSDFSIDEVERAVTKAIQSCRYFPKPVELRELVEGSIDERAQSAWVLAQKANRLVGGYCSLWVEDPCLACAIVDTFGGWVETTETLARLSDEMIASQRKNFLSNYRLVARSSPAEPCHYLAGRHELNNRANGAWSAHFPDGRFSMKLGVIADNRVVVVSAAYNAYTGELEDECRMMLKAGDYAGFQGWGRRQRRLRAVERPQIASGPNVDLKTAIEQCQSEQQREGMQELVGVLRNRKARGNKRAETADGVDDWQSAIRWG